GRNQVRDSMPGIVEVEKRDPPIPGFAAHRLDEVLAARCKGLVPTAGKCVNDVIHRCEDVRRVAHGEALLAQAAERNAASPLMQKYPVNVHDTRTVVELANDVSIPN